MPIPFAGVLDFVLSVELSKSSLLFTLQHVDHDAVFFDAHDFLLNNGFEQQEPERPL